MTVKNKIRAVFDLIIAALMLTSVLIGYAGAFEAKGEYCFISGALVGAFFLFSFIYAICKKKFLPVWLYLNAMLTLLIILIATLAMGLNLKGAFVFIHIINPIVFFLYWCVFCNHNTLPIAKRFLRLSTVIIFPICYFIFTFILLQATGKCPFPLSLVYENFETWRAVPIIIAIALGFLGLSTLFDALSRVGYKLVEKKTSK